MEYNVKKNDAGVIISISRADGAEVPIDAENEDYINFVNWAAKQATRIAKSYEALEADCVYLNTADQSKVVDYCKNNGQMLFAAHIAGLKNPRQLVQNRINRFNHAGGKPAGSSMDSVFLQLQGTEAVPSANTYDPSAGIMPIALPLFASEKLLAKLNEALLEEESEVRKISTWPVEKTFVYFDVSGFSRDHRVGQQAMILNSLIKLIKDKIWWRQQQIDARADCESSLCIGDGYIYVFSKAHLATCFAAYLANLIEHLIAEKKLPEFHFRVSVHKGPVYRFWDVSPNGEGKWNYVGKGITDAERVLSAAGKGKDDVVYVSAETREAIMPEFGGDSVYNIARWLQNRGRLMDKHGQYRRIYEVNHTGWMEEFGYSGSTSRWR